MSFLKTKLKNHFSLVKKLTAALFLLLFQIFSGAFLYAEQEITTITITNARQTSYEKDEETGNDSIILEGSVYLTVAKGETSSEIKADKITYDRKTQMLYAAGNVEITTKSSSAGGETTTADTLLMNTSTLEGIFDNGRVVQTQSDALNLPSGSTLIVFSQIFGKGEDNTIAFKNSSLTFCDEEDPHWHINASRTWLLPGGEFAFFNAFLFVGVIPVLYLPAFYYPKDEIVFNPVFGHRSREGYFLQTTTYLIGRKPIDSSSSDTSTDTSAAAESLKGLYNFMKPSTLKEQKLEGIVLHNLDENYTGNTTNYLKFMGDWYSKLGTMVGFDGNFVPKGGYISKLKFDVYTGFSNVIFKSTDGDYLNYSSADGKTYTDSSNFLGKTLGFRYGANFEFALSKPFTFSLSLPIYSDPYFAYDFKDRQETMDWISYFLENTSSSTSDTTISEISSYSWTMNASYSPTLPSIIKPFINSLSMSVKSSVNISSMATSFENNTTNNSTSNDSNTTTGTADDSDDDENYPEDWYKYTSNRKFYYPSQVTPVSASLSLSGTILQFPFSVNKSKKSTTTSYAIEMNKPDEIKTETQKEKERLEEEKKLQDESNNSDGQTSEVTEDDIDEETQDSVELVLPSLVFTPTNNTLASGFTYSLGYSFNTNVSSQISYASSALKNAEDFDWENIKAYMYTVKAPFSLNSNLNYGGSVFSLVNTMSFSPVWQKHPVISTDKEKGGYSESEEKSLILADYNAETRTVSNTNTVSFKPFYYTDHFSETGINYKTDIKLFRRKFLGDIDNPEWEDFTFDKDDECITVNSIDYVLGLSEAEKKYRQTVTFTQILPPLNRQYTGSVNLVFPYVTASLSSGYEEISNDSTTVDITAITESENWKKKPLSQALSVSLFNSKLNLTESYNYDLEEKKHDSLKFSVSWSGMQLSYIMQNTLGADLDTQTGWINREEKEFLPYSLSFSYSTSSKTFYKWQNRINFKPNLSTSIIYDMIKPTNSYFLFSPTLTFNIHEFLNISFSSISKNSILYWYFHEGFYDEWGGFPGNVVKDLIDSFRFDQRSLRKASGFKIKTLNMSITHELHDWKFNMTFKFEPRLVTENNVTSYNFNPYITIGVVWNPMESIKTEIKDEYGEWQLNTD